MLLSIIEYLVVKLCNRCVWGGGGKWLRESCGWVDGWAIFRAQRTSSPKLLDKYYQNFIKYHDFAIIFNTDFHHGIELMPSWFAIFFMPNILVIVLWRFLNTKNPCSCTGIILMPSILAIAAWHYFNAMVKYCTIQLWH